MTTLLDVLSVLGRATWEPVWIPVLVWTGLALPFWALLDRTNRLHPHAEYRLLQVLLSTLPVGMIAAALLDEWFAAPVVSGSGLSVMVVSPLEATARSVSTAPDWEWIHAVGLAAAGAGLAGVVGLSRLLLNVVAVVHVRSTTENDSLPEAKQETVNRLAGSLGVRRTVRAVVDPNVAVPMTLAGLRPTILLPPSLIDRPEALRLTLTHELVHLHRYDDVAHVVERFLNAVFSFHPLAGRIVTRIAEARERACDAAVLSDERTSASSYARLLATFADGASPQRLGALSLSETPSSLINRLNAMRSSVSHWLSSPFSLIVSLLTVGTIVTLGVVACSDSVAPSPSSTSAPSGKTSTETAIEDSTVAYSEVKHSPMLVGGMKALQEDINYPEEARKAGIEGQVLLEFIVDKKGGVRNLRVKQSADEILNEAALQAVKEQTFEPGSQRDGERVPVRLVLPVTFKLSGDSTSSSSELSPSGLTEALPLRIEADGSILVDDHLTPMSEVQKVSRDQLSKNRGQKALTVGVDPQASPELVRQVQKKIRPLLDDNLVSRILYRTLPEDTQTE